MITAIEAAVIIIMDLEGGDKVITDSGGLTKYGVSQKAYPDLDIRNLTFADAAKIFKDDYWDLVHGDELPSPLNVYVVDAAYNMGPRTAMKILQRALGNVSVDGRWGPRTQSSVTRYGGDEKSLRWICNVFNQQRCRYYIGVRNFDNDGDGWYNRVFELVDLVWESECIERFGRTP
jgi:lysozyme family protein